MPKFKNDTSKTRLGDQYQYLIALECCINSESDNDIIYVEQRGDVATEEESTEVKHHIDEDHKISDRHVDFWKTLKNWVENYDVISSYKKLVLLTTSNISEKSKLIDWNKLTKEEKLEQIKDIKEKKVTETIKKFVDTVFTFDENHTEERLLEILDKFYISYNEPVITEKVNQLLKHSFFKTISSKNKKSFLNLLLSYILAEGRENAENWEIKISEFNAFVEYNSGNYTSSSQPIPDTYKNTTADINSFENYKFVQEIAKIELEKEVQNAVNDYYRTQQTVIEIKNNDVFFDESFAYYQDDVISKDLEYIKSECELEINDKGNKYETITQSKKAYYQAMKLELKQIKGYSENQEFFQRGTIHTIVNSEDNNFCWCFEE